MSERAECQDPKLKQLNGIQPSAVLSFKEKNLVVYFWTHKKCVAIKRLFFIWTPFSEPTNLSGIALNILESDFLPDSFCVF